MKLLRITSYVYRFIYNIRNKEKSIGHLSSEEIENAKMMWIKHVQKDVCMTLKNKKLGGKNDISQLGLMIDRNGIVRCYGRLNSGEMLNENAIHPIYLPRKCYFTVLLIKDLHVKLLHSGTAHTLSMIRREFWIPKGRKTINDVLRKCYNCVRFLGGPFKMPKMMDWPQKKVHRSAPFKYTGLDYLGPIYARDEEEGKKKICICLFTCIVIRAVHLEVVSDMSAEKFIMALRRFISRRGKPDEIILDNASQFKVVKTVIDFSWKHVVEDEEVCNYVSSRGIRWSFITEFAPWEGGFYERLVGMVKMCIRKTVGPIVLSFEQMCTFSCEIESVMNSRPLVYVDGDYGDVERIISPANYLSMIWFTGTPEIEDLPDNKLRLTAAKLLDFWKKGQKHLDNFWRIWRDYYLLSLRERYQRNIKSCRVQSDISPSNGLIVHIKDKMPRGVWKMGRIVEVMKGKDGEVRSAKIRLPSGAVITRPINLLYPLEADMLESEEIKNENLVPKSEKNSHDDESKMMKNNVVVRNSRLKRKAALLAQKKLSQMKE